MTVLELTLCRSVFTMSHEAQLIMKLLRLGHEQCICDYV